MAWVKSEYAGAFAVLSTWLVSLLPWSVTYFQIESVSVVALRFLFFRVQYIFGASVAGEKPFLWTWEVPGFAGTPELVVTAQVALAAAVVYLAPLGISVAYYLAEERVESLAVDPVRVIGALLGVVGLLFLAGGAMLFRYRAGLVAPIGAPVVLALSYLLLTADRT